MIKTLFAPVPSGERSEFGLADSLLPPYFEFDLTDLWEGKRMSNKKQTSHRIASKAGEVLGDPNASNIQRSLAASALAQSRSGKESSEAMQTKAAKVLNSEKYSETTKELAGSVLSQSK